MVDVVLDAFAFALQKALDRVGEGGVRQPVRAGGLAPASARAPSCARPARRLRSAARRVRCTTAAAGSSRPRSAGNRRVRARPSSGRRPTRGVVGRQRDQAAGDRLAVALGDEEQPGLGHASPPCDGRSRGSGRAGCRARGRCGRSSGRRSPSRRSLMSAPRDQRKLHAGIVHLAALLADLLALVVREAGEEGVEVRPLPLVRVQWNWTVWRSIRPASAQAAMSSSAPNSRCSDESSSSLHQATSACTSRARLVGIARQQARARHRREGHGDHAPSGSRPARAARRRWPRPSRTRTRRRNGP